MLDGAGATNVSGGELVLERSPAEPPGEETRGEGIAGSRGVSDAVQRNRRGNPGLGLPEHFGAVTAPLHDHDRSGFDGSLEQLAGAVVQRGFLGIYEDSGGVFEDVAESFARREFFVVAEIPKHLRAVLHPAHRVRPGRTTVRRHAQQNRGEGGGRVVPPQSEMEPLFEYRIHTRKGGEAPFRTTRQGGSDRVRFPGPAEVPAADAFARQDSSDPRRERRQHIHLETLGPRPGSRDQRPPTEGTTKQVRADLLAGKRKTGQPGEDEIFEGLPGDQQSRHFRSHETKAIPFHSGPVLSPSMLRFGSRTLWMGMLFLALPGPSLSAQTWPPDAVFHDAHYHPTDYIQRETALPEFLGLMGDGVGRAALMGIPLQQKWDWFESGDRAPDYYLRSDAALYYYPFVDAMVAEAVLALPPEQRARFDPMITGFNPTDMYAADHIRRVLRLYPGVFSGIGEFSIHKEVVSPKTVGHGASLRNPALDRILEFAGEVGLLTLIHNDVDVILPREGERPTHLDAFVEVVRRHSGTTIVWAHAGIGRFVEPTPDYVELLEEILRDDSLDHLYFDLSWDVVAEQIVGAEETRAAWIALVNAWPDRFIVGSDSVVAKDASAYEGALEAWKPLLDRLDSAVSHQVRLGNYERLFDAARRRVRAWEAAQR